MPKQVMVKLEQIKRYNPLLHSWEKVVNANGGVEADLSAPFPLSSVLTSNDLDDTLWCFRCVPEHKEVLIKFILFCARESSLYSSVQSCTDAVEDYLEGRRGVNTLTGITDYAVSNVYLAAYDAAVAGTENEDRDAYVAAEAASKIEVRNQVEYLRKLLDGEL